MCPHWILVLSILSDLKSRVNQILSSVRRRLSQGVPYHVSKDFFQLHLLTSAHQLEVCKATETFHNPGRQIPIRKYVPSLRDILHATLLNDDSYLVTSLSPLNDFDAFAIEQHCTDQKPRGFHILRSSKEEDYSHAKVTMYTLPLLIETFIYRMLRPCVQPIMSELRARISVPFWSAEDIFIDISKIEMYGSCLLTRSFNDHIMTLIRSAVAPW